MLWLVSAIALLLILAMAKTRDNIFWVLPLLVQCGF